MRKIECACGISHDIYSWPPAEVEQNGKKMMERHITCTCTREVVVRTAPKYEDDAEVGDDEKVATVTSFAELSRKFGVLKEAAPHNTAAPPKEDSEEDAVDDAGPGKEDAGPRKKVQILAPNRALFATLIENYAKWFKQGKASKEGQKKFFDFHQKVSEARGGNLSLNDEEIRMARMALSPRNLYHLWGDETPKEIQGWLDGLKSDLKEIL